MGRLRRKRIHKNIKDIKKKYRTRRKTKDLDQIHEDLKPENVEAVVKAPIDGDLPGFGQFYCVHCTRHFAENHLLVDHMKTKTHKKRVKNLSIEPYSQKEAEMAAGMGSYVKAAPVAIASMEELHAMRQNVAEALESAAAKA
eukprot:m.20339 g.20339  ORF g.20339 m.20339 type:complete len:142 (+) comp3523_c0_seq1:1752-2177(+)